MDELQELEAEVAARAAAAQAARRPPPAQPQPQAAQPPAPQPQPQVAPPNTNFNSPVAPGREHAVYPQSKQYDYDPVSGANIPRNTLPPKMLSPVLAAALHKAQTDPQFSGMTHTAKEKSPTTEDLENPTYGMTFQELMAAGYGRAGAHINRNVMNAIGAPGYTDQQNADANSTDQPLLNTTGGALGNMAGETAASIPMTMGIEAAAPAMAARALAANRPAMGAILRSRPGISTMQGAGAGLMNSDPNQRTYDTMTGALGATAIPMLQSGLRKAAFGMNRTPGMDALLNRYPHFDPTPGEANPAGMYGKAETMVSKEPYAGALVNKARTGGTQDWQRIMLQEAAPEIPGGQIPAMGRDYPLQEGINDLQKKYSDGYNSLAGYTALQPVIVSSTGADVPLVTALKRAATGTAQGHVGLDKAGQQVVDQTIKDVMGMVGTTSTDFTKLQGARSHLRQIISNYALDSNVGPQERAIAARMRKMEDAITNSIMSQLPADDGAILAALDRGYGGFKVIQDATRRAYGAEGREGLGFAPIDVRNAVRARTSVGDYVRGDGVFRDFADVGMESLKPPTTSHGSAIPYWLGRPLVGAAAFGAGPLAAATLAPEIGTGLGSGTRTGRRLLLGRTGPQQLAQRAITSGTNMMDTLSKRYLPNPSLRELASGVGASTRNMMGASLLGAPMAAAAGAAGSNVAGSAKEGPVAHAAGQLGQFFDLNRRVDVNSLPQLPRD